MVRHSAGDGGTARVPPVVRVVNSSLFMWQTMYTERSSRQYNFRRMFKNEAEYWAIGRARAGVAGKENETCRSPLRTKSE